MTRTNNKTGLLAAVAAIGESHEITIYQKAIWRRIKNKTLFRSLCCGVIFSNFIDRSGHTNEKYSSVAACAMINFLYFAKFFQSLVKWFSNTFDGLCRRSFRNNNLLFFNQHQNNRFYMGQFIK